MTHNIHHHKQYQRIETRCGGGHNLEISWGTRALDELAQKQSAVAYVSPERRAEATLHHSSVDGIAFTYSSPTVWLKYVIGVAILVAARERRAGLQNIYFYDDKGYNCADSNLPIAAYLDNEPLAVHRVKKCAADCCGGDESVLLKQYEHNNLFHNA